MGDLNTFWNNPPVPTADLSGEGATSRGTDPNAEGGDGPAGLQTVWPDSQQATTKTETAETPNSVSRLPPLPNRFQPDVPSTMEPPNLQARSPANVDKS